MKKLLFVAVLGVIALSSCKKEKDCECITKQDGTVVQTVNYTTEAECTDMNTTQTAGGMTQTMTCSEK
jgi:hypothetical protein